MMRCLLVFVISALALGWMTTFTAGMAAAEERGAGDALYRDGVPAVLGPAETAVPIPVPVPGFRDAYQRAGAPRIVVFWMRSLGDQLTSPHVTREVAAGAALVGVADSTAVAVGGYSSVRERTTGLSAASSEDPLGQVVSPAAQAAFTDSLLQSGVRLIDRAAITRLKGGDATDPRVAEAAALKGQSDVLVEITATGAGAPDALVYALKATRVSDGVVLVAATLDEEDLRGAKTYEPSSSGGYRLTLTPRSLGYLLASSLQRQLAARW